MGAHGRSVRIGVCACLVVEDEPKPVKAFALPSCSHEERCGTPLDSVINVRIGRLRKKVALKEGEP